ncbi:sulfite exporter TauE/SafE family protein [Jannaschia sp. S6380]|uniref:sulfite exporter TauE/SafE family protein n=1 Tax=Jannaschia sp. S6380 TaxID=2926408 RepID=UPI001FF12471|nr:sulfite exporter TauE/SafE family protein [Jannaschia sp. S6380]MCK0167338.1 sulfite exporter TauE/SafE family protein [Jannaschia sp. S6380]
MPPDLLWMLLLGAASGGLINGLAGFGTALFALGFWLQVMPPVQAVSIVVVMSVASGLQGVWLVRHAISTQRRRLARFLLPALPGIPVGLAALSVVSAPTLKITIAVFMLLYGGFFSARSALPRLERPTPVVDGTVGFLGGVLGGAASLSGALPTMWCAMRPWPKSEVRAVLQPFNVAVLGVTMMLLALGGAYDRSTLGLIALALPVTMISAQVGIAIFKRLGDDQFRRLIIAMMFVSGAVLLLRELT